jgi:hypothetical protein
MRYENAVPPFRLNPEAVRRRIAIVDLSDAVSATIASACGGS